MLSPQHELAAERCVIELYNFCQLFNTASLLYFPLYQARKSPAKGHRLRLAKCSGWWTDSQQTGSLGNKSKEEDCLFVFPTQCPCYPLDGNADGANNAEKEKKKFISAGVTQQESLASAPAVPREKGERKNSVCVVSCESVFRVLGDTAGTRERSPADSACFTEAIQHLGPRAD